MLIELAFMRLLHISLDINTVIIAMLVHMHSGLKYTKVGRQVRNVET